MKLIKENPLCQYEEIEKSLQLSKSTVRREIQEIKKKLELRYDKKLSKWIIPE